MTGITDAAVKTSKGPAKTGNANIRDIAAAAGVSVATVSRVMRGNARVSDATRTKVEQAVKALGYVPNAHARALTTPPNSITLVMRALSGGTYNAMAGALAEESVRRKMSFRVIVTGGAYTGSRVDAKVVLTDLLGQRPRVAIITADDDPGSIKDAELNTYVNQFQEVGTSLVALGRPRMGLDPRISVVYYAGERGMHELTRYLISLGHRDILYVGIRPESEVFNERYRGFLAALTEAGIRHDTSQDLPYVRDGGANMAQITDRYRTGVPFTAVVGATDMAALDAIKALMSAGVSVPDQVSVAGFDDMPLAGDLIVPLTTVRVPYERLGAASADAGLNDIRDVIMPTDVVVRRSTAPIAV
ncbi:putative LacI family transcriptional regulator [Bifidobacterium saguini DSM 23967]|uniref:LacI family DNA-binding transcriptional regulator n=2 Tax=Bifidobacterium saguini TaxID=762210 RepID=A0ABX7SEU6_9BIFI|nr:LacI family DNA-binding transcriptional regulator [Bifidobacterium saguini]KFI92298.1 putative LacI family transcriptional regulator [Bifidobacterium saguini DSM 23967]QTB91001.1 LacI family DNA-binding transcriptional regulator [Bifidobacterium saguini]